MDKTLPVLVYGTLRPGDANYDYFIKEYRHTVRTVLLSGFALYGGDAFPYIVPDETGIVVCDLIDFHTEDYDEALRGLDFLEGYRGVGDSGNHYDRTEVTVNIPGQGDVQAYVYVASVRTARRVVGFLPRVEHGDWLRWDAENNRAPVTYKTVTKAADDDDYYDAALDPNVSLSDWLKAEYADEIDQATR